MHLFWIGVFGLAGVFSRYGLDQVSLRYPSPIPIGTLGINIAGSFLAGLLFSFGVEREGIPAELRTGIFVGFLGGFTTFSAYSLQTAKLLEAKDYWNGFLYWGISPVLGLLACLAGLYLGRAGS